LIASKQFAPDEIIITENRESRIVQLKDLGFRVTSDNPRAVQNSAVIIMSVKPQQFGSLADEIKGSLKSGHTVISTITGITLKEIESVFGKFPMLRIMPNIALEINESMTCVSFRNTGPGHEKKFLDMFGKMGKTLIIPEDMMGAATVLGACGLAFALRFMRAMSQGGIEIGFDSEMALLITAQTVKGAARLVLESKDHPEREIDKVTTPQGITISGLNEMEHQGLSSAVIRGLLTSFNKLENLAFKSHKAG
jgi:pyrroline-5-carboxylate reductase